MKNLTEIRTEIDKINDEIFALYLKRLALVEEVAKIKKRENLPVSNPAREAEIISALTKKFGHEKDVRELFDIIIKLAKEHEHEIMRKI